LNKIYLLFSLFFFCLFGFVGALSLLGLNGSFEDCSSGCEQNEQPVDWNISYYTNGNSSFVWDVQNSYVSHGNNPLYEYVSVDWQKTNYFYLLNKSKVFGGKVYFDMPYMYVGWGFFCDAGTITVNPQFVGDNGDVLDLNTFSFSGGCGATTSIYNFASEIPRYQQGKFRVRTTHAMFWAVGDQDVVYYDNFRYTKGSATQDSDLDGVTNNIDNCPFDYNPDQNDSDQFYYDDFNDGLIKNLTLFDGQWSEGNGLLTEGTENNSDPTKALITDTYYPPNTEITVKIKLNSWQSGDLQERAGIGLRTNSDNGRGYTMTFRNPGEIRFLSDNITWGPSTSFSFDVNKWYWMKMRIKDNNILGKAWSDGEPEPENWMLQWQRTDYGGGNPALISASAGSTSVSFDEVSVKLLDFNVGDGIGNACDNCPTLFNIDQNDIDGDGKGNACDGITEGYLRITNPKENDSVLQRSLVHGTFTIKDINGSFVQPLISPQYKIDNSDWNSESFGGGYGVYDFYFTAPETIGEHTLTVKAYANNAWLSHKINFNVIPYNMDLKINFIKAIQVIEDVDLVAGKATAVKIGVNNTNNANKLLPVTVRLKFNDQNYFDTNTFYGDSNFIFYVNNPYQNRGTYTITAEVDPYNQYEESDENNLKTLDVTVVKTKSLTVRFRPVDLNVGSNSFFKFKKKGNNFYVSNEDDFNITSKLHAFFIRGTYPVEDVVVTTNLKVFCPEGSNSCMNKDYNYFIDQQILIDYLRLKIEECLNYLPSCLLGNETKIVGLTDDKWFVNHGFTDRGGYAQLNSFLPVFVEYPNLSISAHEIGHTLGLCDEYKWDLINWTPLCPNSPPEGCGNDSNGECYGKISDGGIWVDPLLFYGMEMYSVDNNILNPYNVFNYMGSAEINLTADPNVDPKTLEFRRFTDKVAYNHLINKLKDNSLKSAQQTDLNILLISGTIDKNFDVNFMDWFVVKGGEFGFEEGNCVVRTLDKNNFRLKDYNFSLFFEKYSTTDFNYSPLWMGIEFDKNIHKVQVLCHDENIAERTVSANPPAIEITSPTGGETWDDVHSITWNASDAEGDSLFFVLKYSDDNGTTWNSLDYNVTDTNYQFDVGMVNGNTEYKIKVIATDGVLTSEAVSGTFTIKNPNIEVMPNEWDLGTINNLSSPSRDFNLVNSGNADLNVFDLSYSSDLNVTGLNLPVILASGAHTTFNVKVLVSDMNFGSFSKDINISSNDPNQIIKRVKVYGTIEKAKPDFSVSSNDITFSPAYPEDDMNVVVNALIHNLGDLNASNVNVRFYGCFGEYAVDYHTMVLYHANTGSGTTLIDATGNVNGSFLAEGEPSWTTNSVFGGYALSFDGVNDKITLPDSDYLDFDANDSFTLEAWIKTTASGYRNIIRRQNDPGVAIGLRISNTNKAEFLIRDNTGNLVNIVGNTVINNGNWHHIAGVRDKENNVIRLYVDEAEDATAVNDTTTGHFIDTTNTFIGSYMGVGEYWNGIIDEIRISNEARTSSDFALSLIDDKNISFIDANSSELVSVDWNKVNAGDYNVFVVIDYSNVFDEKNESNNKDSNSITVYSEPIISIEFSFPALNDLGELFDLNAIIENNGAKLLDANAELALPEGLTTSDSLIKFIGDMNSHTSKVIEWHDINSTQAGLFEITVKVKGLNADVNASAFTSIRHIELSELNLAESYLSDQNVVFDFNVINFNSSISYTGLHYNINITGPTNYNEDKNIALLYAGETRNETVNWENQTKQLGDYNVTITMYNSNNIILGQKHGSFKVVPPKPSMSSYYSLNGLNFNLELTKYAEYFSSASDENGQIMIVYSYEGDLNYTIRNPLSQTWSNPIRISAGNYPYLVGDGNSYHLVYVDSNVYYKKYSNGNWSSPALVSLMNSVDPVLSVDGNKLYVLFSSMGSGQNYNVFLAGFNGSSWREPIELTHCVDANCSNPIVLDKGLVNGKLSYAYRKYSGEEYSSSNSKLMYSLYDVNYFYWGG